MDPQDSRERSVNPAMVVLGREARGFSQKHLAIALGVQPSRISMVEMGLRPVSPDLLAKLVEALDFPQHFFTQEGSVSGVGVAELFHRKRQNVPQHVLARVYALIEIRVRHVKTLLQSLEIISTIPHLEIDAYGGSPEEIARVVRAHLQLPRGPIEDMTAMLEEAGVPVMAFDFNTRLVDAISRLAPALPPLFFVNEVAPKDRCRYSLAHELGHVVMHSLPNPDMEVQANRFAAEFLLPEREIRHELEELNLAKLAILKGYWRVSMAALLKRAGDLGTISYNQARYLWAQMAKAGYKTREPVELDLTGEQPQLIRKLVDMHRTELGYTDSDLRAILPLNEEELDSWYLDSGTQTKLRVVH